MSSEQDWNNAEWAHVERAVTALENWKEETPLITTEDLAAALAGFSVVLLGSLDPQQQEAVISRLKPGLRRIAAKFEKTLAGDALEMTADMLEESDGGEGG